MGCSSDDQPCPEVYRIRKIPKVSIQVTENGMNKQNTKKAIGLIQKLRKVEDYYFRNSIKIKKDNEWF